jgi:hypothetical protein
VAGSCRRKFQLVEGLDATVFSKDKWSLWLLVLAEEKQKLPDVPFKDVSPSSPICTFHIMAPISSTAEFRLKHDVPEFGRRVREDTFSPPTYKCARCEERFHRKLDVVTARSTARGFYLAERRNVNNQVFYNVAASRSLTN